MIDRLLRHMFELLVALFVLSFLIGLGVSLLRQCGAITGPGIARAIPRVIADVVVTLLTGVFFVGLGVRAQQLLTGRGARAGQERGSQERQARLTVRRPAEGVPAIAAPELPADPDPAIVLEED